MNTRRGGSFARGSFDDTTLVDGTDGLAGGARAVWVWLRVASCSFSRRVAARRCSMGLGLALQSDSRGAVREFLAMVRGEGIDAVEPGDGGGIGEFEEQVE